MKRLVAILFGLLYGGALVADNPKPGIMLILDGSSSMGRPISDVDATTRIVAARLAISRFARAAPPSHDLALRVFTHCPPEDRVLAVPFQAKAAAFAKINKAARELKPTGFTPLAASLKDAVADFAGRPGEIILITDNEESCDPIPGPCSFVAGMKAISNLQIRLHVIGLAPDAATRQMLQCMANEAGTKYQEANKSKDLAKILIQLGEDLEVDNLVALERVELDPVLGANAAAKSETPSAGSNGNQAAKQGPTEGADRSASFKLAISIIVVVLIFVVVVLSVVLAEWRLIAILLPAAGLSVALFWNDIHLVSLVLVVVIAALFIFIAGSRRLPLLLCLALALMMFGLSALFFTESWPLRLPEFATLLFVAVLTLTWMVVVYLLFGSAEWLAPVRSWVLVGLSLWALGSSVITGWLRLGQPGPEPGYWSILFTLVLVFAVALGPFLPALWGLAPVRFFAVLAGCFWFLALGYFALFEVFESIHWVLPAFGLCLVLLVLHLAYPRFLSRRTPKWPAEEIEWALRWSIVLAIVLVFALILITGVNLHVWLLVILVCLGMGVARWRPGCALELLVAFLVFAFFLIGLVERTEDPLWGARLPDLGCAGLIFYLCLFLFHFFSFPPNGPAVEDASASNGSQPPAAGHSAAARPQRASLEGAGAPVLQGPLPEVANVPLPVVAVASLTKVANEFLPESVNLSWAEVANQPEVAVVRGSESISAQEPLPPASIVAPGIEDHPRWIRYRHFRPSGTATNSSRFVLKKRVKEMPTRPGLRLRIPAGTRVTRLPRIVKLPRTPHRWILRIPYDKAILGCISHERFQKELRLFLAIQLVEVRHFSNDKAAQIAGLSLGQFLLELQRERLRRK